MSALIEMATNSRPSSAAEPPPMMTAKSVHPSTLLRLSSPFASCTHHCSGRRRRTMNSGDPRQASSTTRQVASMATRAHRRSGSEPRLRRPGSLRRQPLAGKP
jgi:hypothetical protein